MYGWLISSAYRSKTNMDAKKKVKIERDRIWSEYVGIGRSLCSLSQKKTHLHPDHFSTTSSITKKYALLCSHPVWLCLYFGHSAAPNPYNYVASVVLNDPFEAGIGRNVSGLALSPNFNVKQHRWRENSYDFQVGGVLFVAFGLRRFSGWIMRPSDLSVEPKINCRECNITFLPR